MRSSLRDFRTDLSQTVLNCLWSAWSQVGVMGGSAPSQPRVVDPEPLLLLTWECARQDARAFDEVLDWLVQNGRWINVGRLTTLLEEDQVCVPTIAGAVAAFMAERLLESCYTACLDLAAQHLDIKTLAFCCISTGEFRFPKVPAAQIAVRLVLLELGVGFNTPGIIRWPFEHIALRHPSARLVRVNLQDGGVPGSIGDRSISVPEDLARVLGDLAEPGY